MQIRDRIKELRRVKASELRANPKNWRQHPASQRRVLEGILKDVGFASAIVAYEEKGGLLTIIDGHLRADISGDDEVPVLVLDVTADEADFLLATMDPVGALGNRDQKALNALLAGLESDDQSVQRMLAGLSKDAGGPGLKDVPRDPPKMAWVLIGIPTVRYGEIAAKIEELATLPGVYSEIGVSNAEAPPEEKSEGRRGS